MILPRLEIHAVDHCTQRCRYCSHGADTAQHAVYHVGDYLPWLQRMTDCGVTVDELCVIGGEPFLHPNLPAFLDAVRPFGRWLSTMSNLFWLWSESDIDRFAETLGRLDALVATYYSTYGGFDRQSALVEAIRKRWPKLAVVCFSGGTIEQFAKIEFHRESRPVVNRECNFRKCPQLFADGTMARCCASRRHDFPEISGRTRYDLRDMELPNFADWAERFPPECSYCSIATEGVRMVEWVGDCRST